MARVAKELSALTVAKLSRPGRHAVGVVPGLCLQVPEPEEGAAIQRKAKTWILRITVGATRREIGLGGYPAVTLAQARDKAREVRALVERGIDPVQARAEARSALIASKASALTFEQAAAAYIKAHELGWKSAKHAQQWRNTLEQYAHPVFGLVLVSDVDQALVLRVLEPIWKEKTETASRLRGRIESVLDWAKGRGYRTGDNPAAWKGNLDAQLAAPTKVAKIEHHPAVPVDELGAFMARLRAAEGMGALALEFAILTAARSGEVRGARWQEIDLEAAVWTVPAERMKTGKEHRVPLSTAALDVLKRLPRLAESEVVFSGPRGAGELSDMTLSAVMRRMKVAAVPHGFRSTFRDWAAERTNYPREVAEMALAHAIGDKVEAAYRRGDLFDKRRRMMAEWAAFCATELPLGTVIPINRQA